MLEAHPRASQVDRRTLAECVQACTACADACLAERELPMLVRCIRLNLDCADVCEATGRLVSRQTEPDRAIVRGQLQACVAACRACGAECERHAQGMQMEHCRVCAGACRRCAEACERLLAAIPA
jgi:hypothetical protein